MDDLIEAQTEQPRDHLEFGDLLAVAVGARVGRNRLLALLGKRAVRADLEAQRGGKTFVFRMAGLSIHDNRNDAIDAPHALEAADFLVDVFAARSVRRA